MFKKNYKPCLGNDGGFKHFICSTILLSIDADDRYLFNIENI